MTIKYYDNIDLVYTTRRRYKNILPFEPFAQEEQRAITLGDGAYTHIKTSSQHICNYVTIGDTRWFVLYYEYLNRAQVVLYLQRDVIGEFGLDSCFGKIERGYTETVLRNRKELNLNQVLKERKHIKPLLNRYGNYGISPLNSAETDYHKNEMWGIIYFKKPAENTINIPIKAFLPKVNEGYDFVENNTIYNLSNTSDCHLETVVKTNNNRFHFVEIYYTLDNNVFIQNEPIVTLVDGGYDTYTYISGFSEGQGLEYEKNTISNIFRDISAELIKGGGGIILPSVPPIDTTNKNYNNIVIKKDDKYYSYSETIFFDNVPGNKNDTEIGNTIKKCADWLGYNCEFVNGNPTTVDVVNLSITTEKSRITYTILEGAKAGTLVLDVSQENLIDEPYFIIVFPLFNTKINGKNSQLEEVTYNIDKTTAFSIFNDVIEELSGADSYIVDAQIYPYCPSLMSVVTEIEGYPFFSIQSTSYNIPCSINLYPLTDIKKEYIEREYSIVSPDQSSKFTFSFYDYKTEIIDRNGINYATLNIIIKTALKPFSIISSAVIQPDGNSLVGVTYASDLRGCKTVGNGFECSLVSNAFETYKRQNSNYQAIFNKQQESLIKEHNVERVNDATQTVVNTLSLTAMGALAGASMADAGLLGAVSGSKAVGATIGGTVAGEVTAGMMITQTLINEDLRKYEEKLQKEMFDLQIGTIKNLPNSVDRISSFNEIILNDFWYTIEIYECTEQEKIIVNNFISQYGYGIGVYDNLTNYHKNGWFLRAFIIKSNYNVNLHMIAEKELEGGIYYYD